MGEKILEESRNINMSCSGIKKIEAAPTSIATLFLLSGEVKYGLADFSVHQYLTPDMISSEVVEGRPLIILDCDTPMRTAVCCRESRSKETIAL